MTDPRPTPTMQELINLMHAQAVEPTQRLGPGYNIQLPEPYQSAWERRHGGNPVLSSVIAGMERRGLVIVTVVNAGSKPYRVWRLA